MLNITGDYGMMPTLIQKEFEAVIACAPINEVEVDEMYHLVEWEKGVSRAGYARILLGLEDAEREGLYMKVLAEIQVGHLSAASLLSFVTYEPHPRIVSRAVKDFLVNRNCNIDDEFAGVNELIQIMSNDSTANRGAILAGLVALGDRRINAVARAARHILSSSDIRNFSRVQFPELRSSSVEFCLDWLIELNQSYRKEFVDDIACSLQLMVLYDEKGVVEDVSEIEYVGFKKTKMLQTRTFESFYCEIRPILNYLRQCQGFQPAIDTVIEMWKAHRVKAADLRKAI